MWLRLVKDQHHTHHLLMPEPLNRSIARHSETRYIPSPKQRTDSDRTDLHFTLIVFSLFITWCGC